MSDCVVDASVAVKWFIEQPLSDHADAAIEHYDFHAPDLILAEVANAFWKYWRAGVITREQALGVVIGIENNYVLIEWIDENLVFVAQEIALFLDHPIYDCLYLALAEKMKIPFLTADTRLISKAAKFKQVEVVSLDSVSLVS